MVKMDNICDLNVQVFWLYRMILIIMEVPKMMRKVDSSEGNLGKLVFFEFCIEFSRPCNWDSKS